MKQQFIVAILTLAVVALGACEKGAAEGSDAMGEASVDGGESVDAKDEDTHAFGLCPPRDDSKALMQASAFPLSVEAPCVGGSYSGKGRVKRVSVDQPTGNVLSVVIQLKGNLMCGEDPPEVTIIGTLARSLPFVMEETVSVEFERNDPSKLWIVAKITDADGRLRLLFHRAPGQLTRFEEEVLKMRLNAECEIPIEALGQAMCYRKPVLLNSIQVDSERFGRDENALIRIDDHQLRMVNGVEWEWREAIPGACNPRHTAPEGMFIDFHLIKED